MGGVLSDLCVLLCKSGCRPSAVASALSFFPPEPPFYSFAPYERERTRGGDVSSAAASSSQVEISYKDAAAETLSAKRAAGSPRPTKIPGPPSSGPLQLVLDEEIEGITPPLKALGRQTGEDSGPLSYTIQTLKSRSGNIVACMFLRHADAGGKCVIVSHGNATDCGAMWERYMEICFRLKINVLGWDYSGYGMSTGTPTEANTYKDIEAVYDFAVSNVVSNPAKELFLYGQSVGSGPSCKIAANRKRPIAGLILHSPIMSGIRVLTMNRGPLCCCDIFPNIDRIRLVRCPVFIIHGEEDEQVDFAHGRALQDAVPEQFQTEPYWVKRAGHNDIVERNRSEFFRRLKRYFGVVEGYVGIDEAGNRKKSSRRVTDLSSQRDASYEIVSQS